MKILIACEESQAVTIEFRKLGHEAFSCDLQECSGGHPEWHIKGDVFEVIQQGWDLMIAHPPCTYLTVTANKWLKDQPPLKSGALVGKERRDARLDAIDFFMKIANAPIDKIAIENPIGCMSTVWRKADQLIHPYYFGDEHRKATCLWLKNLPLAIPGKVLLRSLERSPKFLPCLAIAYHFGCLFIFPVLPSIHSTFLHPKPHSPEQKIPQQ